MIDEAMLKLVRIDELKNVRESLRGGDSIGQGDPFFKPIELEGAKVFEDLR